MPENQPPFVAMSEEEHRPTILVVGQGEPMQKALGEALRRHRVSVAGCATAELEQAVRVYAPDLVVLIGDAAVRGGASVVRRMAANRSTDVLPVAVVSNDAVLKHDVQEFRSGAVAVVPRGAGADAIARRLAELAEEVPQRPGLMAGTLDEDNLQDVVNLVSDETKTGILSIRSPEGPVEGMPVVVETEGASAHNMERILKRLREAMAESENLEYEFHEASGGRLSALPGPPEPNEVDLSHLHGVRLVILDSDELRAEKLAQVLIQRGVQIAAADFSTAVIPRIREIDPQVVVLDSSAVGGRGIEVIRGMRKDPQLRWASMLVVRWEDFWPSSDRDAEPDIGPLAARIRPLIEQDVELAQRVEDEVDFDTRLELVGPGRLLRALGSVPGVRHVAIAGQKRNVEVDIADNSIVGAYATLHEGTTQTLQGMPALLALWGLNSGRVSVREQDLPSVANIMMPVDEALVVVSHQLGFADGSNSSIEVNAETVPPAAPGLDEHATMPPGAEPSADSDDARTMAPPRFRHLRTDEEGSTAAKFSNEEGPTNRVQRMLGRVETQRRTVPVARGAEEHHDEANHIDHAVARSTKSTQLGLAPVFEALPEEPLDAQKTIPVARKRTPPPPPPQSRKHNVPAPPFDDGDVESELARVLEGATVLAPAHGPAGTPAWLQGLLLVTLVVGVGVAGWILWSRSGSTEPKTLEPFAEAGKGPIVGSVNGLEDREPRDRDVAQPAANFEEPDEQAELAGAAPEGAAASEDEKEDGDPPTEEASEVSGDVTSDATPEDAVEPKMEAPGAPPKRRQAPSLPSNVAAPEQGAPSIPTQNLPRDPAKASDVLVHRALRMIRSNDLALAEATLDRAWELDPRNPQAMAGYATLYIATKDAERAVKWSKKAVRKRSKRPQYHVLYGDALALAGDVAGARKAWRKALSIDPENRAAKARLARNTAQAAN